VVVVPSEGRAEGLPPDAAIVVAWNVPSLADVRPVRTDRPERPRIHYHGSINADRLPLSVLDALEMWHRDAELHVAGYTTVGDPSYMERFLEAASRRGLGHRVRWHGTVPTRADALDLSARAHIGLSLLPESPADHNLATMVGASNKPFDYMACGCPVVVNRDPAWVDTFVQPGFGESCDPRDPRSIADAWERLVADPHAWAERSERCRQQILGEWNYETSFKPVLDRLQIGRARGR
jgi:glycosyltransferase involved in cell wall biosynthesis